MNNKGYILLGTGLLILLCEISVGAGSVSPFTGIKRGVPSDVGFCAAADRNYLYLPTYTDPAKLDRFRLHDLAKVDQLEFPVGGSLSYSCPVAIRGLSLYLVGYTPSSQSAYSNASLAEVRLTGFRLSRYRVVPLPNPVGTNFLAAFTDVNYLYLIQLDAVGGTQAVRFALPGLTYVDTITLSSASLTFLGLSNQLALFGDGSQVYRYQLGSLTLVGQHSLPFPFQLAAVTGPWLFAADGDSVVQFSLVNLTSDQALVEVRRHTFTQQIFGLQSDPLDISVIHVYTKFVSPFPRDPTPYPYQYSLLRSLNLSLLVDNVVLNDTVNQVYFFRGFGRNVFFHYLRSDVIPSLHLQKYDTSANTTKDVKLRIGTEHLVGRAHLSYRNLYLTSPQTLYKKNVETGAIQALDLPGTNRSFGDIYYGASVFAPDQSYVYYALSDGSIVKICPTWLQIHDSRPARDGYWTKAAAAPSNTQIYFYLLQQVYTYRFCIARYEYISDSITFCYNLTYGSNEFNLVYSSDASPSGDLVYLGVQNGNTGLIAVLRFNFNTNQVDRQLVLNESSYIVSVRLDPSQRYLVVTADNGAFKIDAEIFTINASLPASFERFNAIVFTSTNYLYLGGPDTIWKVDFASFTLVQTIDLTRASASYGVYDSERNATYFGGQESFVPNSQQPSNLYTLVDSV